VALVCRTGYSVAGFAEASLPDLPKERKTAPLAKEYGLARMPLIVLLILL